MPLTIWWGVAVGAAVALAYAVLCCMASYITGIPVFGG